MLFYHEDISPSDYHFEQSKKMRSYVEQFDNSLWQGYDILEPTKQMRDSENWLLINKMYFAQFDLVSFGTIVFCFPRVTPEGIFACCKCRSNIISLL